MPTLRVVVLSVSGLPKNASFMDKTDPYVQVTLGMATGRTSAVKNAGQKATYNEAMTFPYDRNEHHTINVQVWDDDGSQKHDDVICSAQINLQSTLGHDGHWRGPLPLVPEREYANKVDSPHVNISFTVQA